MQWYKSESTIKPDEVDTTSSKTTIYLRRNISEKKCEDEFNGENQTYFEYDEATMTKKEYADYLNIISIIDIDQQRADIDYLAIMTGVEL